MTSSNHVGAHARAQWRREAHAIDPRCEYCGVETIEGGSGPFAATVDHKQSLAKNGLDRPDNFALACRVCNESKGAGHFHPDIRRDHIRRQTFKKVKPHGLR